MLIKLRYQDYSRNIHVEAYTDGFSVDSYGNIFLLSVVGQDSAAKAITAAAVQGKEIEVIKGDGILTVYASSWEKHRILSAKLRSGCLHQILVKEALLEKDSDLVFIPVGEKVEDAVFRKIQKSFATPVLPEWAVWIYSKLREEGAVQELQGNVSIVKIITSEKELDELVSEGLKNKEIRFPVMKQE